MHKVTYLIALSMLIFMVSCEKYQEQILPVVGVYEANVVGIAGPFSLSISVDYGDNVSIDAPWDGELWDIIDAEIRNEDEFLKKIKIHNQSLDEGIRIWGEGFFFDYTIQLDYTIQIDNERYHYTIVGTKL